MSDGLQVMPFSKPDLSKIPKKVSRALTRSDRLALLAYAQTTSITEAGLKWCELRGMPGQSPLQAEANLSRKISQIRKRLEEVGTPELFWEALGLDAMRIAEALGQGMRATMVKPMVVRSQEVVTMTNIKGETYDKVIDKEEIKEAGPYADHPTRVKAAETTARLRGDMKRGESMTVTAGIQGGSGDGFKFLFVMDQR